MSQYVYVRQSVEDFDKWKAVFDGHAEAREAGGATGTNYIMRNADDANEVVVILEWSDLAKAREFAQAPELKEAMQKAGVTGPPDIRFLELVD